MDRKLKEVFQQIQAEDELKNNTKVFLQQKTQGYTKMRTTTRQYFVYAAACVCFLFMLFGGRWLYFTPVAQISIDINPSIELSINRFDQVISVNSFNKDGQELVKSLNLKIKNYTDAINQIMNDEKIMQLLSNNEIMTITVTGADGKQSSRILSNVETCTAKRRNTYCYLASSEEVSEAHEMGLSCGKYKAFLEIQELDASITPDEIQNMTMREIRELIYKLSKDNKNDASSENNQETLHHGNGNCHRKGQGNGRNGHNK